MIRCLLYALAVGVSGTLTFWLAEKLPLAVGWWCGTLIGFIHFYSLRLGMKHTTSKRIGGLFFLRYLALAGAFFLILRLGREQLGSSAGGFLSFYVVLLIDYLIQFWKQKRNA